MKTWLTQWSTQHRAALQLALRRLMATPFNTLLSVLAIGIALSLPASGWLLLSNVQSLTSHSPSSARISIYLPPDAQRSAATALLPRLQSDAAIKSVQFLPREETLARMKRTQGLADVIEALPGNPFPDAFVLTPSDESPASVDALATRLRALPGIEHVQLDSAWVHRLDAMLRLGRSSLGVLSALLGIGLMAITFNTIRLQLLTQGAEIEVCRLLGATETFIRRPYFYFGLLQGLGGGLLAWLIVSAAVVALTAQVTELARLYSVEFTLRGLAAQEISVLLALAVLLCLAGAALSLRQHVQKR